jgi:S1-C subfamily serine protease
MFRSPRFLSRAVAAVITAALTLATFSPAHAGEFDHKLYEKTMPAMVWIFSPMGGDQYATGTGTLVDIDGETLVLTVCHVVDDRPNAVLFFAAKNAEGKYIHDADYYKTNAAKVGIKGKVVFKDRKHDVALIKPDHLPKGARALPLATRVPKAGEVVYLVGNSQTFDGMLWRYRAATVESVGPNTVQYEDRVVKAKMVLIEGHSDHGDSGGPVLNAQGEVVSVISGGPSPQREQKVYTIQVGEVRELYAKANGDDRDEAPRQRPSDAAARAVARQSDLGDLAGTRE